MAGEHQPQTLGFLLIGRFRHFLEMPDHFTDQYHERFGRRFQLKQAVQRRISRAFFGEYFRVQRRFRRKMLEQQTFRNRGSRRDAFGRRACKAVTGAATLGCTQYQLPPQVTGHAKGGAHTSK
ncbi:hypothetical protein GALL_467330 [mine drainage metagenome]|uniref:Uncharacterized protein n=1 Tax=mine drainage metagenome TaxID=410659 RepID=A0A1J5Q6S3_9ZZZZ